MRKLVSGLCALVLVTGIAAGCSDSGRDQLGENPADRTPSASPSTSPSDNAPDASGANRPQTPASPGPVSPGQTPGPGGGTSSEKGGTETR